MAMGAGWTTERVLALAPDAAASKAGQGLAAPRKWANLGQGPNLVWGECQGAGSKPYQTKVAPDDAATSCSCPSRKFPCKHALGLLLVWVDPTASLPAGDPPPWVAAWVETRAKKAGAKLAKAEEAAAPPTDNAAKAKREAARLAKVAAGLEDLDLWLGDLVRAGLAALGSRPRNLWDEQARRLVDAQCPGVARRLRQIDALPRAGDGWQTALLDRLAQIHLLIEGFRHRDNLPPAVLADVRAAIGFPLDLDGVRAGTLGESVRDTWGVLGQASALEEKITVRRTWLQGAETGRSALILDFSALSKPFETIFEPGTAFEATLGFLPSATPLRALVLDRSTSAELVAARPGGVPIAVAQANLGAILARSPWVEQVAVVLDQVVCIWEDKVWSVVDPTGATLPLPTNFDRGWEVVALGGGGPVTLAAEFDGATLNPLGAWADGTFLPLTRPTDKLAGDPSVGAARRWLTPGSALLGAATTSALIGVDRKAPPVGAVLAPVLPALAEVESRPAPARLLALAAAAGLTARVGRRPVVGPAPVLDLAPATEDRPACSPASARRLRGLLAADSGWEGQETWRLVAEWFAGCDGAGQRLPVDLLVDVLNLHRQGEYKPAVAAILGTRGWWLAGRNPVWHWYAEIPPADAALTIWETGTRADRLSLLYRLRIADPAAARQLVERTFATDPAAFRSYVIDHFERNLSAADEPFLEAALDDRGQEVRKRAAQRLQTLPTSRLAGRMAERARDLLGWAGDRLQVEQPSACDPAMIRDGISPVNSIWIDGQSVSRNAAYLHQILTIAPLAAIQAHLDRSPGAILDAANREQEGYLLIDAWQVAALAQRDLDWCRALVLDALARGRIDTQSRFPDLFATLPPAEQTARITEHLASGPDWIWGTNPAIRLISAAQGVFDLNLGRAVLGQVGKLLRDERGQTIRAGDDSGVSKLRAVIRDLLTGLDRQLPFDLIPEATALLGSVSDPAHPPRPYSIQAGFAALLDRWIFRHAMHQEFPPR